MIVATKQLFAHAYGKYALGAYNINNLEQIKGMFQGCIDAKRLSSSSSPKARVPIPAKDFWRRLSAPPKSSIRKRSSRCIWTTATSRPGYECIESGFYSSVMIDASHDDFEENVAITRRVVEKAHAKNISVEAELGQLGGVEEDIQVEEKNANLTDPDEALEFVKQTGCDSLACAIGTSHGAYKFSGGQGIHFDRVKAIQTLLPGFPLVMHGSSSVPQDEVARIKRGGRSARRGRRESIRRSTFRRRSSASAKSISIPMADWSGRGFIASSSTPTPKTSICAAPARSSWRNTPSSSPAATCF